jgi:flagellar hook-associated protein 3 FlgL
MIRATNAILIDTLKNSINQNRDTYSEMMVKISEGKKYLSRSEDVVATNEVQTLKNNVGKNDQWINNLSTSISWTQSTSSVLSDVLDSMQRLNELAVEANDGTNAANRSDIASEVNQILEGLVTSGNSEYVGNALFSGTGGATAGNPFSVTRDANGQITEVTYTGSTTQRSVQTASSTNTFYGVAGISGTGSDGFNDNKGLFTFSYNRVDTESQKSDKVDVNIFTTLIKFRDKLANADYKDWKETISDLQASTEHVISKTIDNSTSQKKLETISANINSINTTTNNRLSEVEDLDVAAAASDLQVMQSNLQASLLMVTKLNGMSIVNFI